METIRYGSFETNSSSTHAIVVPKQTTNETLSMFDSLDHDYSFGREECRLVDNWEEKLAYAYIVVKNFKEYGGDDGKIKINRKTVNEFKKRVNKIYDEVEKLVEYKPYEDDPKPNDIFKYIDNGGKGKLGNVNIYYLGGCDRHYPFVDHWYDFDRNNFLERILTDDEFLKRFIFDENSYITIGSDEHRGYNIKTIGFQYDYEEGIHNVNEKGEEPTKEWLDDKGCIKDEYWDRYIKEYPYSSGEFWDKLKEYEKKNDVYLKGN